MKLYVCSWPNGDVSFVYAGNKGDAVFELDEVGGAAPAMLRQAAPGTMIHFDSKGRCQGMGEGQHVGAGDGPLRIRIEASNKPARKR